MLADLVDRHDVGVVHLGGGLGLDPEPLHVGRGGELAGADHLQGDDPLEAGLPGLVDDAHAAVGDLLEQLVIADALPVPRHTPSPMPPGEGPPGQGDSP